ncbi:ABC-F family ATP-binding cassette domain-containing protein [Cohaesibacter celericrescens]|uniref:Glycosyl transferase family 1 n=1 Tax=Cohaesibacter celericrescens TaxID=2067669 RepID=A0A2N5XTH7_9HYPH|nr:ABC-F family ATP-binding cassette domain-containing protein [Cohaesibacter celericrescens]PLW77708.1 glycosyl transferase family 1 [Cohaesibacter celericrescens]
MLHINNLTYRVAGRILFEDATLVVPEGSKIGLVGRNGTGKTTLFKLLVGELSPESGTTTIRKGARIGQVAQEAPASDESLLSFVLKADLERAALLAEAETATDPHRIADIHLRLTDIDAHSAESRAATILHGLGFDTAAQQRPTKDFSGGWRMRVALAAILFSEPDLLLLDEPTNYLDLEGALWLENYIDRYPYTVMMISHDRDLLNKAVNHIAHLDQLKLTSYRGGYDNFERTRREQLELQQKMRSKQLDQRKHLESFINRFKAKATKAKQAQSRVKALEKMKPIAAMVEDHIKPLTFPNPEKLMAPPLIRMENASVGYEPGKPVLRNLDLRIDPDDRLALLGANGNGKSTFAKLISNRLDIDDGHIFRAGKLKIAFFAQHQLDELRPDQNAFEHVRPLMPNAPESRVRARVAQMGLGTDKMDIAAKKLSGGEKARLLLGLATFDGPHLLILDEPTNHLDIDSREALVHAINDYEGAVVLISHDRHLIEACVDQLWIVHDGTCKPYDGDLDDYRRLLLSNNNSPDSTKKAKAVKKEEIADPEVKQAPEKRRSSAEKRKEQAPLRRKIQIAERDMIKIRVRIEKIDEMLANPNLYARFPEKGAKLSKDRVDLMALLGKIEEKWLEMSEEVED